MQFLFDFIFLICMYWLGFGVCYFLYVKPTKRNPPPWEK